MRYLFILFFLAPFSLVAQFSKGTIVLGGNLSYSSTINHDTDYEYPASKSLSLNPNIGMFVSPSFSIHVFGQISSQKYPQINVITNLFETEKLVSKIYGLAASKYFSLSDKFMIMLSGRVGTGNRMRNEDKDTKSNQFLVSLGPSLIFFPHKNWGIAGGFGSLSYEKNFQQYATMKSNRFSASLGSLAFGVNYLFNRKD